MLQSVHYHLKTTSLTAGELNAVVTYDVNYDSNMGIAYEVALWAPEGTRGTAGASGPQSMPPTGTVMMTNVWHAKIVNRIEIGRAHV